MKKTAVLAFAVFAVTALVAGDLPSQFGLTAKTAGEYVVESFTSGMPEVYSLRGTLKSASPDTRAQVTSQVLAWTKAYVASPSFKAEYAKLRNERKPAAPTAAGSVDDELSKQRAEQQKQIDDTRKSLANLPPDQRKAMEKVLADAEAQIKELAKDQNVARMQRQGVEAQRADETRKYNEAMARWNRDFPADPNQLVVRRLREFLATSATVDFNARLSGSRFVNPDYEHKPDVWKMCYRAGRLPVEKARAFAQSWLGELGAK